MSEPNECPRLMEVHRLWEGEIDARRVGEVRQHLAHCSCCRVEYENWKRLSDLLARGDPAPPLVPERQRLMKEKLLAEGAASLDAVRLQSAPRSGAWHWRMPIRIALALAPLALAALLLAYAHRGVPPGEPRSTMVGSHLPAPMSPRKRLEHAGARLAFRPPPPAPPPKPGGGEKAGGPFPPPPGFGGGGQGVGAGKHHASRHPIRAPMRVHWHRIARMGRPVNPTQDRRHGPASRRTVTPESADERVAQSLGSGAATPQPIQRIVIQDDERSAMPPVGTGNAIHITIIASGNLQAPGAQLTIVKSRREETLP